MKTDVLIIGGGLTARRAASIASEKYRVTLISDGAGASPYIHGLNVPLHPSDSEELFLSDTMRSGWEQNDPSLAKALVRGSLNVAKELGSRFDKTESGEYDLLKPLGAGVPRVAGIGGRTGALLLAELRKTAKYTELSDTRALSLIKSGEYVVGARVFDKKRRVHFPILAKAVLVATGGFGGIFRFSTNSPDIGGDGAAMIYGADAALVDMEFIQYEPTVAISPEPLVGKSIITTMLFEGAVMRNKKGERFMDEQVGKDALSEGISREIARGGGTDGGGVFYDMTAVPKEMLTGKYRDYYERYLRHGIDISKTPVEIAPAPHTTMGGALINESAETTVKGLFAAGEAAGGIHGANRLGGNAGLEVLVFGDLAGRSLVRFLDEKLDTGATLDSISEEEAADEPFDGEALREQIRQICDSYLGVVKSKEGLTLALKSLESIINKTATSPNSFDAMRIYNDAVTLTLTARAALERTESVGSHIRFDGARESGEKYRIILRKTKNVLTAKRQEIK